MGILGLKLVFETTALLNLPSYSIFLWLHLPDLIGSMKRLLYLKPRYGPSSAFLTNIFFALKGSKLFILIKKSHFIAYMYQPCHPLYAGRIIFKDDIIRKLGFEIIIVSHP